MNNMSTTLLFAFIAMVIHGTIKEAQSQNCQLPPPADQVKVRVYISGNSADDITWISQYCAWKLEGMPYGQYAPISVKVGAIMNCDEHNKCTCPIKENPQADCTATYKNICVARILGEEEYLQFLCCVTLVINQKTREIKGFDRCVTESKHKKLAEELDHCLKKTSPETAQDIALKNAHQVIEKGVDVSKNSEPIFFFNGKFDKCINDHVSQWLLQTICQMLKEDIAKKIPCCVAALS